MRILQTIIQKLACIALLAGGAAIAVFSLSGLYQTIVAQLPQPNPMLRIAIGCVAAALAIFALLPLGNRRRRSRELRFNDDTGPVTIQLDPIATTLNKTFTKIPVVKKGTVHLTPTKAADKANVHADVHLLNPADASVRETSTQLKTYLDELARRVIGAEEIGEVSVNIVNTESAAQPAAEMQSPPVAAEIAAPARQSVHEPMTADEALVPEPAPRPDSEDLVTYEESVKAAEEEEQSLTGHVDDEPELAVAWDADDALPKAESEPIELDSEPSSDEDTSFDSLADQESPAEDNEKPASGP